MIFDFRQKTNQAKRFVAIYGENGSGKSNFVRSVELLFRSLISFDKASATVDLQLLLKNSAETASIEIFNKLIDDGDVLKYIASCRMIDCDEPTEVEYGFLLNGREGYYKLVFSGEFTDEVLYHIAGKQRGILFRISSGEMDGGIEPRFWSGLFQSERAREDTVEELHKYWGKHTFLGLMVHQMRTRNTKYVQENFSQSLLAVIDLLSNTTVMSKRSNRHNTSIISRQPRNVLDNLRSGKISKAQLPQLESSERILQAFFTQVYADI